MKIVFAFFILLCTVNTHAQANKTNKYHFAVYTSFGAAQLRYLASSPLGIYYKGGVKYSITNNIVLTLSADNATSNNYPKDLVIMPNSTINGDQQFVQKFIGITENEWMQGKTNFQYNSNSALFLNISYNYWLGNKKNWAISPNLGLVRFNNHLFTTYIGTAYFSNNKLTGGMVNYTNEFYRLWGFEYGFSLEKKVNNRDKIFLQINGASDNGAVQKSYTTFKMGIGYELAL